MRSRIPPAATIAADHQRAVEADPPRLGQRPAPRPTVVEPLVEGVLLRLALWLAEVAAEAALASRQPEGGPRRGLDARPLPGGAEAGAAVEPTG